VLRARQSMPTQALHGELVTGLDYVPNWAMRCSRSLCATTDRGEKDKRSCFRRSDFSYLFPQGFLTRSSSLFTHILSILRFRPRGRDISHRFCFFLFFLLAFLSALISLSFFQSAGQLLLHIRSSSACVYTFFFIVVSLSVLPGILFTSHILVVFRTTPTLLTSRRLTIARHRRRLLHDRPRKTKNIIN
jgi:hypothetical protein